MVYDRLRNRFRLSREPAVNYMLFATRALRARTLAPRRKGPTGAALGHEPPSAEFVEQHLGILQVGGVEPLGEPAVDRPQEILGLRTPALLHQQCARLVAALRDQPRACCSRAMNKARFRWASASSPDPPRSRVPRQPMQLGGVEALARPCDHGQGVHPALAAASACPARQLRPGPASRETKAGRALRPVRRWRQARRAGSSPPHRAAGTGTWYRPEFEPE